MPPLNNPTLTQRDSDALSLLDMAEELWACAEGEPLRGNSTEATCAVVAMALEGIAIRMANKVY